MQNFFKIFFLSLILSFYFFKIILGNSQIIILTGSQDTGSNIFVSELSRQWGYSKNSEKIELVKKIEHSQLNRLDYITNNKNTLAIIDAKTAYNNLKNYPSIKVLSVLWENWLFCIGNSEKNLFDLSNSKTFLIHENSFYFAEFWKTISKKTKFKWFNEKNLPNFDNGLYEEVLVFTGPKNLREMFYWLEKYAGLKLLFFEKGIIKTIKTNYKWLIPKKLPPNTFPYQSESILGLKWHPVLVGHSELSEKFVISLLKIIFSQKEKIIPHSLFKNLLISDNKIFRDIFSFHDSSKKMFRLK